MVLFFFATPFLFLFSSLSLTLHSLLLHSLSLSTLLPFFVLMVYNSRTERKRRRIVDEFLTEFTSPDFSANDADFLTQGHAEVREDAWAGELNQFSQEIELKTDSVAVSPFHCRHSPLRHRLL